MLIWIAGEDNRVKHEMNEFAVKQRWASESEPELGLGTVVRVGGGQVGILFSATGTLRQYAIGNAPLRRVRFKPGDTVRTRDGATVLVKEVKESRGLLVYCGTEGETPEDQLSDVLGFSKPQDRLVSGRVDEPSAFALRHETLVHQHRTRGHAARGFAGGRIDLIPHQLFIAREVSARYAPRVLLADEVGLGKTIETCLILHRLLLSGRIGRVLILVPESLVHQWFVELYRKFNLWFSIFDEERCDSIETHSEESNPFLDDQLILTSIGFLSREPKRREQAKQAGWDMLVVDEAHHLRWEPENSSPEYGLVEDLSRVIPGLLLLTGTPEQLGLASHFARLKLLDPDRYSDLEKFREESTHYAAVARVANKLLAGKNLSRSDQDFLRDLFASEREEIEGHLEGLRKKRPEAREELLEDLLDRHGAGRVMFRNTRAGMKGFPRRIPNPVRLEPSLPEKAYFQLSEEFMSDADPGEPKPDYAFKGDARIDWLADLLRGLKGAKILLICRYKEKVAAIETALRAKINVKLGLFHEDLSLIQRDKNAAWFADEDGAQILLCSEIGSEGRNFQFAHHLVLFDLPLDPELLEQRIGRLDRIGQTSDILIHMPYIAGSSQEVPARWYAEGLDAIAKNVTGGGEYHQRFREAILDLAVDYHESPGPNSKKLARLIAETRSFREELAETLEKGRDRLLEMRSFRPKEAAKIVEAVRAIDDDPQLEDYLLKILDHFGIHIEELGDRGYLFGGGDLVKDKFPGLPNEGMVATCSRAKALSREDIGFVTWEHPLVGGAMEMLLGSEAGNASFGVWPDDQARDLFLEAVFVLESIAPAALHIDRFLAPMPIRALVDQRLKDCAKAVSGPALESNLEPGEIYFLSDNPKFTETLLPRMLEKCEALAQAASEPVLRLAQSGMAAQMNHEIQRLKSLRKMNDHVRESEIEMAEAEMRSLGEHLSKASLRLDSVRLIWRGPRGM